MISRPFAVLAAAALVAASVTPARAQARGPQVADFTLANGLELVVIPDHRAPVVTHMIWYKVGAGDETPGKSGLAHFLEHLMFKGTAKHPAGRFSDLLARMGGQENAFTTDDFTAYFQRVPAAQLDTVMAFEADRMTGLQLTDAVLLPERQVILEERNQRIENNPRARLGVEMDAALYLNSPYHKPVIGWRHEVENLSRADVVAFYRRFYCPNNAVVVIAGDVAPAHALALAQETYGKIKRDPDLPPRHWPTEPRQLAARTVMLADARVETPTIQRAYLVPSFDTGKRGESEAITVLAHILGRSANSRLYQDLVVDKKLAVASGAWYGAAVRGMTKLQIYAVPRPGVTLARVEREMDAVIARVKDKGVGADELALAKTHLIAEAVYGHDSQTSMARWFGAALMTGATVNDVEHWPDRIGAVSGEAVQDAARHWLVMRRSVTGYLVKDTSPHAEKRS